MKHKTVLNKRKKWYIVETGPALAGRQFNDLMGLFQF